MYTSFPIAIKEFSWFLLQSRFNKVCILLTVIGIVSAILFFKMLYPYAGFISGDSYVYLQAAYLNSAINTYPIGYSRFLRLFSVFSSSDTLLVIVQYLFVQAGLISLLFSSFFFYRPARFIQISLLVLLPLNPVLLYVSNYIASDALFLALSLLWFTHLIWLLHVPSKRLILSHTLLLLLAFSVRYNALFYPFISLLAFLASNQKLPLKLAGSLLGFATIAAFILTTTYQYQRITGEKTFSPFTSWQLANNAIYAYQFVTAEHQTVPARFSRLHQAVQKHLQSRTTTIEHPEYGIVAGTAFMWDPKSPLQQYMNQVLSRPSQSDPFYKWTKIAPLYKAYGYYLIQQHPLAFFKYYLWPNLIHYYTPPLEFLGYYNMGKDTVQAIASKWFNYKNNKVTTAFQDNTVNILNYMPIYTAIINLLFLFGYIYSRLLKNTPSAASCTKASGVLFFFWGLNLLFSVFASPIALRFTLFPTILITLFTGLFIHTIVADIKPINIKERYPVVT